MRCRHVVLAALHVKVYYVNSNLQLCVTHVAQTFADDVHKHHAKNSQLALQLSVSDMQSC